MNTSRRALLSGAVSILSRPTVLTQATEIDGLAQVSRPSFWSDVDRSPAIIERIKGRLFIGNASLMTDNRNGPNGTWLPTGKSGPAWGVRDAQLAVMQSVGGVAIGGFSRVSDHDDINDPPASIGVGGFVVVDGKRNKPGWALYADIQHEPVGPTQSYGLEIAAKNKGQNYSSHPYHLDYGVYGIWLAGGGDSAYGGVPLNPSNSAIVVLKNKHTWNKGIVFAEDSLTRQGNNGLASAIQLARQHAVEWIAPDGRLGTMIRSDVASGDKSVSLLFSDNNLMFTDSSGNPIISFESLGSQKSIRVLSVADDKDPEIRAIGKNAGLHLTTTGSGMISFGEFEKVSKSKISGFIRIKDVQGSIRKIAIIE